MAKVTFHVVRRAECAVCAGTGVVESPFWRRFWATFGQELGGPMTEAEILAWAAGEGDVLSRLPAEEVGCEECDGEGAIEDDVLLEEALAALSFGG